MTVRRWLIVLVAVAFAIRLGFFLGDPNPAINAGLTATHGEIAHNISGHGEWFVANRSEESERIPIVIDGHLADRSELAHPEADRNPDFQPEVIEMPGLAVLLAASWALTGDEDYGYVQVLQIVIDSLMALVVFWIALRLYGRRRAALIAAGIYAVFLPIAAMATVPHLDTWGISLTLGTTALFIRACNEWPSRRWRWLLALGVLTGLGIYFRPGVAILPPLLALAAIPVLGLRRAIIAGGVPFLLAMLLMAPWTIRNAVEYDAFIPNRIAAGQSLWEGLGEIENDFGAVLDDVATERQVREERPDLEYGTPEYDAYLQDKAVQAIKDHPGFYARLLAHRVAHTTVLLRNSNWANELESPGATMDRTGDGPVGYVVGQPFDALRALTIGVAEPLLFLIALLTLALTWRRRWQRHLLLIAVVVGTIGPYIVLHVEPRFALPASFAYMILAGLGADLVLSRRFGWSQPTDTPLQPPTSTSGRTPTATRSRRSSPSADRTPTTSPSSRLER
jgi:4-amino-4-deoxy-L-arabinose transferase-like glycosyltransferase